MTTSPPTSTTGFCVPLPLNRGNARLHWRAEHKEKRAYWDSLNQHLAFKIIPNPPLNWPAKARVTMTFYLHGKMDRDNLYARCKWPLDWLAGHGYIAGDAEDQIVLQVQQRTVRKHPRLHISIEALDGLRAAGAPIT